MTFALFIAVAILTCIVLGMGRAAGRADVHAEASFADWQAFQTKQIINTVRRQQSRRSSLDRHLIISQMARPWRREQVVDEDFEDLGTSG